MNAIEFAKKMTIDSSNIVAFTGAGASTESNIPDFRSAGGLYGSKSKYEYPPETMLSRTFFVEHTEMFFDYYKNNLIFKDARPNDCHKALAELEASGRLKAVITQNVDGLHQSAGSKNVIELHGSVYRNSCMKCGKKFGLDYILAAEKVPVCDACEGIVKPEVTLYEEMLNEEAINKAVNYIRAADVLIVIGTSLVVYPAAGFVDYYRGGKLILINKSETSYDSKARVTIHDSAGKVMSEIVSGI